MDAASIDDVRTGDQIPMYEFDKDQVQKIELDLYSKSGRIEGKYGKVLDTKPVQIWNLINSIMGMAQENEVQADVGSIFVARRDAHATLSDQDRDRGYTQKSAPINKWTFEKSIALLNMPNIGDDLSNARIALTLNKEGLSVAFGMNVHVCTNFNVMGGTILRAYKHGKNRAMPWELMEHRLREWFGNMQQMFALQVQIRDVMIGREIQSPRVMDEIFGDLYLRAIHSAYPKTTVSSAGLDAVAPFDTNELSKFAQESLKQRASTEIGTVWDLYNWGTSIMKPGTVDIGQLANSSNDWASYLTHRFELDVPEYEVLTEGDD